MLAFFKRRWILLSCVVVLLACSSFQYQWGKEFASAHGSPVRMAGWAGGDIYYFRDPKLDAPEMERNVRSYVHYGFYSPKLGDRPEFDFKRYTFVRIPIWLPLSIVLGWIVFRELRWREKRAKSASVET